MIDKVRMMGRYDLAKEISKYPRAQSDVTNDSNYETNA